MLTRFPLRVLAAASTAALLVVGCSGPDPTEAASPGGSVSPTPVAATVPSLHPTVDEFPEGQVALETPDGVTRHVLVVKLADSPERRAHGLMHVERLPDGFGMLFVFDGERHGAFWMKNTLVPLDIAFAAEDGEILAILQMDPCEADPCPTYDPGVAYQWALEVPQGWFGASGVAPGWRLRPAA